MAEPAVLEEDAAETRAPATADREPRDQEEQRLRDRLQSAILVRDALLRQKTPETGGVNGGTSTAAAASRVNAASRSASKRPTDQRKDWIRLGVPLALAFATAVFLRPAALPRPLTAPEPRALSLEIELSDVSVVGNLLYAKAAGWQKLGGDDQKDIGARACAKAEQLGFGGLILFDAGGDVALKCASRRAGKVKTD